MMGECRGCRWWTVEPEADDGDMGECELTRFPETQPVPYPRVAFVDVPYLSEDDEAEGRVVPAALVTSATFGCNQFAPKAAE